MSFQNFVFAGLGIFSMSGAVLFGTFEFTKQSLGESLGNSRIVFPVSKPEEDDAWKKLKEKIMKDDNNNGSPETEEFKKVKRDIGSNPKALQDLCSEVGSIIYSSIFWKSNDKFLKDTKNFCTLTIEELVGAEKKFKANENNSGSSKDSEDKAKIQEKVTALSTHKQGDGELDEVLKDIKSSSTENERWKKLLIWCEIRYSSPYLHKDDNTWKLVNKYCLKDSSK